jgi:hypothetical protein
MDIADIKEILSLLNEAKNSENWDLVDEVLDYMSDYLDDDSDLLE